MCTLLLQGLGTRRTRVLGECRYQLLRNPRHPPVMLPCAIEWVWATRSRAGVGDAAFLMNCNKIFSMSVRNDLSPFHHTPKLGEITFATTTIHCRPPTPVAGWDGESEHHPSCGKRCLRVFNFCRGEINVWLLFPFIFVHCAVSCRISIAEHVRPIARTHTYTPVLSSALVSTLLIQFCFRLSIFRQLCSCFCCAMLQPCTPPGWAKDAHKHRTVENLN